MPLPPMLTMYYMRIVCIYRSVLKQNYWWCSALHISFLLRWSQKRIKFSLTSSFHLTVSLLCITIWFFFRRCSRTATTTETTSTRTGEQNREGGATDLAVAQAISSVIAKIRGPTTRITIVLSRCTDVNQPGAKISKPHWAIVTNTKDCSTSRSGDHRSSKACHGDPIPLTDQVGIVVTKHRWPSTMT